MHCLLVVFPAPPSILVMISSLPSACSCGVGLQGHRPSESSQFMCPHPGGYKIQHGQLRPFPQATAGPIMLVSALLSLLTLTHNPAHVSVQSAKVCLDFLLIWTLCCTLSFQAPGLVSADMTYTINEFGAGTAADPAEWHPKVQHYCLGSLVIGLERTIINIT